MRQSDKKSARDANRFRRLRVLVIEDHQDVAANIGDYLEEKGHVVDFAVDGVTGLHLAVTQTFDAIVLDLMLPGMDGITLCRRFREESRKSTPILMLTAVVKEASRMGRKRSQAASTMAR
jgi:DNA-binding response OmpR family regulator